MSISPGAPGAEKEDLNMKTGKTLVELAMEIERQANAKRDFVAPTKDLAIVTPENDKGEVVDVKMTVGAEDFGINKIGHGQIAETLRIPAPYYNRMLADAPQLLAQNANHWLKGNAQGKQLVRVLDDKVRAFLSDRYRPLEHVDLAEAVLPVLHDLNVEIISTEITERRFYIKVVDKRINRDIPTGRRMGDGTHTIFDTISPAMVITNSEVGLGATQVTAGVWTRACTNLAVFGERSMRKYHVGGRLQAGDEVHTLLSDQTKKLTDAATWSQIRDVVKGAFDEARFAAYAEELSGMSQQRITGDVTKTVELAARKFEFNEGERKSILTHLIEGGDLTKYGLFNAITRTAEDVEDYDRASEFERAGGKLVELGKHEWKVLAEAA